MDHSHCWSCFSVWCTSNCPVISCPNGCEAKFHICKFDEHSLYTCWSARVPCTNATNGCEEVLPRCQLAQHLKHCPANILKCWFSYDRDPNASRLALTSAPSMSSSLALVDSEQGLPAEVDTEELFDEECLTRDVVLAKQVKKYMRLGSNGSGGCPSLTSSDLSIHPIPSRTPLLGKSGSLLHLPHRSRICIDVVTPKYSSSGALTHRRTCSFPCNEIVRRDEFPVHWNDYHLVLQTGIHCIVERCPMFGYGCKHGRVRLSPDPNGSCLIYNEDADCFGLKLPVNLVEGEEGSSSGEYARWLQKKQELAFYGYEDENKSYDVLSQLPFEVLKKICLGLDSLSLWSLSQVNHYIRSVCCLLAKKRGIVYRKWQKNTTNDKWEQGPKVISAVLCSWTFMCDKVLVIM